MALQVDNQALPHWESNLESSARWQGQHFMLDPVFRQGTAPRRPALERDQRRRHTEYIDALARP